MIRSGTATPRARLRGVFASAFTAAVAVVGCRFGIDVDGLTRCTDEPDACAPLAPSVPLADASDAPSASCPSGHGPDMVFVPGRSGEPAAGFCIDRTEVTNEQYAAFLGAAAPPAGSGGCEHDETHVPSQYPAPPGAEALPVVFVDYCDAEAYCAWAGKELCGNVDGRALAPTDLDDPERDAWFIACGGPSGAYPYGDAYEPRACNGVDAGSGGPRSADRAGACRATNGALELSGNVWEWTRACEGASSLSERCYVRGGAFNAPAAELTCSSVRFAARATADATTGFRCCAPLVHD